MLAFASICGCRRLRRAFHNKKKMSTCICLLMAEDDEDEDIEEPVLPVLACIVILSLVTVVVAVASEYLVNAIQGRLVAKMADLVTRVRIVVVYGSNRSCEGNRHQGKQHTDGHQGPYAAGIRGFHWMMHDDASTTDS